MAARAADAAAAILLHLLLLLLLHGDQLGLEEVVGRLQLRNSLRLLHVLCFEERETRVPLLEHLLRLVPASAHRVVVLHPLVPIHRILLFGVGLHPVLARLLIVTAAAAIIAALFRWSRRRRELW